MAKIYTPLKQIGQYCIFLVAVFSRREKMKVFIPLFFEESVLIGVNSLLISLLTGLFIGAAVGIQSAYNLLDSLVPAYYIGMVTRDAVILEMGPTLTAMVLAGKVGSIITGNLGTMRISDQIDAIDIMGVNSASYLVLPKIISSVLILPLIIMLATAAQLLGGFSACVLSGIISARDFAYGLQMDYETFDFTFAYIKAVTFGFLIASISSYFGYFVKGGSLEVGRASTMAITANCIAIMIADYLLAQFFL